MISTLKINIYYNKYYSIFIRTFKIYLFLIWNLISQLLFLEFYEFECLMFENKNIKRENFSLKIYLPLPNEI